MPAVRGRPAGVTTTTGGADGQVSQGPQRQPDGRPMTVDALRDLARRHAPEPVKKVVRAARRAFRYLRGPVPAPYDVRPFLRTPDPAAMVATASNDFERLFYGHEGRQSFKTHHYFEIYDRHLTRFRGTPVRILEIGVQTGGSLQLWRKCFGRKATVFGIDIDERCRAM